VARMNPFAEIDALRRAIDRSFESFWSDRMPRTWRTAFLPAQGPRQYPLVNISEDDENLYIEALAPGVDPKTLDLTVLDGTLVLKGEKPGLAQISADAYHRNERAAGRFVREIALISAVDADKIQANYKHGLLLITLPKSAAAKPKQIAVTVGEGR
jgi:HSP20 family protein